MLEYLWATQAGSARTHKAHTWFQIKLATFLLGQCQPPCHSTNCAVQCTFTSYLNTFLQPSLSNNLNRKSSFPNAHLAQLNSTESFSMIMEYELNVGGVFKARRGWVSLDVVSYSHHLAGFSASLHNVSMPTGTCQLRGAVQSQIMVCTVWPQHWVAGQHPRLLQ